jgi:hypothetical protein
MAQKEKLKSFIRQLAAPDFRGCRLLVVVSPQAPVRELFSPNPMHFGI